jgi:expansin (peptidoglycan-binding protein)
MKAKEFIDEHRLVFRRNPKTGKISLRWRCEAGPRTGRTVPTVKDCSAAPDMAQAQRMKKTRQLTKIKQARKSKKTKRINPASRLARSLNKLARSR